MVARNHIVVAVGLAVGLVYVVVVVVDWNSVYYCLEKISTFCSSR